ncbi:hypothetical protein DFO83_106157 [Idiomarina loihiensis]|jgi:hypothetical protein|nr:hypothetical protein DFO83_106157 [Idiomarina loihiensis]TDP46822.1 hypothetical protein DET58_106158 [Idiomarina loihiensis]TDS23093.1 hypothetical protein DET62_106158 [Idiomarina sp. H2]
MTNAILKTSKTRKARFTPNMKNFETSLSYEGLKLKEANRHLTVAELKQKYAR